MKRLLTAAVIVTAAALPIVAHATPITDKVTGTATQSKSSGGPTISPTGETVSSTVGFSPVTTFSSAYGFTLIPNSDCSGAGCVGGKNGTETDLITVTFSNFQVQVNGTGPKYSVPTFTQTGTFTAKYSGSELACAQGDGKSPLSGETDCLIWTGAPNTFNGTTTLFEPITGLPGDDLEIVFFNATDWNISPSFKFAVVDAPALVPEPASTALLGLGLLGTVAFARRRG
jgi:hypothetical protein